MTRATEPAIAPWQPLLEGEAARTAWDAVEAIAIELRKPREAFPGVAEGASGFALFYQALDAARPDQGYDEDVLRTLDEASAPDNVSSRLALYTGIPGLAWVTDLMAGPWTDEPDPHDEIDDLVAAQIESWPGEHYDLISGLVGIGVYTLERLPRPRAKENLERIIKRLSEVAEHTPSGAAWYTGIEQATVLAGVAGRTYDRKVGYYNLGVAHGAPGAVAFLGAACARGHATEAAMKLLTESTSWLLAHGDPSFGYGVWIYPGEAPVESRSAWCYGNPGVGVALMIAGRGAGREDWERAGIDLLTREAARPLADCGVVDPGLCHGSMGLAHIYNRAFQATGAPHFADAARTWTDYALTKQRKAGIGVGGFQSWFMDITTRVVTYKDDASFLTGAAGIGLALLAMLAPDRPRWDGILLTEIP